jgi:hypothetical protein
MDCKTARLLLDFARPLATELEEGDGEALANHLAECSACAAAQRAERQWDEPIGRAMRDVPVPPELRGRLLQRLAAQRDAWYRRRVFWPLVGAAAAACLLALGIHELNRPIEPNLARLQGEINEAGDFAPRWLGAHENKEPPGFDAVWLTHSGLAHFQGKRVPLLEYRHGPDQAWVYVLTDRDFNLKALEAQGAGPSGRYSIRLLADPNDPGIAYVVIFTGPDLSPFQRTSRPST